MKAPVFSLKNHEGRKVTLSDYKGKVFVLYFYPKADTPGCTMQACAIRDNSTAFAKLGVNVIGISPDEVTDLKKFEKKYELGFTLLADPETKVIKDYGVWKEKTFMGRRFMGVERSTFIIDGAGKILKQYPKVSPSTHADMILSELRALKAKKPSVPVKVATPRSTRHPAKLSGKTKTKVTRAPVKKRSVKSRPKNK